MLEAAMEVAAATGVLEWEAFGALKVHAAVPIAGEAAAASWSIDGAEADWFVATVLPGHLHSK